MTKEKITDSNVAAKKISDLLKEKELIEKQLDQITRARELIRESSIGDRKSYTRQSSIMVGGVNSSYSEFYISDEVRNSVIETMVAEFSVRLAEINDSLLHMVRLAD